MIDGEGKQRVKDALLRQAAHELEESAQAVSSDQAAARLDQDASYSVDDLSQSEEAGEYAGMFEEVQERRRRLVATLEGLDFGPKDIVGPGAIVAFGGDHFVVGVVSDVFDCDGVTYEGISADSPIYAALVGLRAGDAFSFNGQEHRVDLVA